MKRTLATLATIASLYGCASEPTVVSNPLPSPPAQIVQTIPQPTRQSISDYVSGSSTGAVTHAQVPYSLDTITLAGSREYIVQPNARKNDGELEFRLTPYNEATLLHDGKQRITSIESQRTYVPTKVMIPSATAGEPATEASEIQFKPLGAYSTKTPPLRSKNPSDIETRTRSQDDAEFNMPKATILGQEFYVAVKRDNTGKVTNTYFVPVESTLLGIRNADRAITLRNAGNIYEIREVADYSKREDETARKTKAPEVDTVK